MKLNTYKTLWPLPGGQRNYIATTVEILRQMPIEGSIPRNQLEAWLQETYHLKAGSSMASRYLRVVEYLGFLKRAGNEFSVTDRGKALLTTEDRDLVTEALLSRIQGTAEVLAIVAEKGPISLQDVQKAIVQKFPSWTSIHQPNYRLLWFFNTGCLTKEKDGFRITDHGRKYLKENKRAFEKSQGPPKGERLSLTDAAERVLEVLGKPVHYRDIVQEAIDRGWISPSGLTPEASMRASISQEIRRREDKGESPRFVAPGKGYIGLAKWRPRGIAARIEELNQKVKDDLRERLLSMSPEKFEELIGELLVAIGFAEVEVTGRPGDGGIDVVGDLDVGGVALVKTAVQVKRWKGNVQTPAVTQLRGSLDAHQRGIIITTGDFSKGAREEARAPGKIPISLIDGDRLIDLIVEHQIGVRVEEHKVLALDPSDDTDEGTEPSTYPLDIYALYKGVRYEGQLLEDQHVIYHGQEFRSLSGAAKFITGKPANGWRFWRFTDDDGEHLINQLRE